MFFGDDTGFLREGSWHGDGAGIRRRDARAPCKPALDVEMGAPLRSVRPVAGRDRRVACSTHSRGGAGPDFDVMMRIT